MSAGQYVWKIKFNLFMRRIQVNKIIFIMGITFAIMLFSCGKTEIEKTEVSEQLKSEKSCVPDAGCAGCPEAHGKVVTTPAKPAVDSTKTKL